MYGIIKSRQLSKVLTWKAMRSVITLRSVECFHILISAAFMYTYGQNQYQLDNSKLIWEWTTINQIKLHYNYVP